MTSDKWLFWPSPTSAFTGSLDAYAAPAGAWSTGRKLRSAYAGSGLKVIESGGSTSADIGFDGSGNITGLTAHVGSNDGFIDWLYDHSGNSRHYKAPAAGNRLRIASAGAIDVQNSHPKGIAIDGSRYMVTDTFTTYTGTTLSGYVVFAIGGGTKAYHRILSVVLESGEDHALTIGAACVLRSGTGTNLSGYRNGAELTAASYGSNGTVVAVGFRFDAATYHLRIGASTEGTAGSSGSFGFTRSILFGETVANPTVETNSVFCEGAFWLSDIGATDLSAIMAEARTYWSAA